MPRNDRLVLVAEGAVVEVAVVDFSVFTIRLARFCRDARSYVLDVKC